MSDKKINAMPVGTQDVRPAPRFALRTFWFVHRAIYRLTGGRLGLSRPETGAKFGMMRLHTLGRRSGQTRVAMIGYYEDGPNLVTMAMNGWGQTEPAWWLNLQATADATVDLPDGSRAVRARAATGEERARLWARFVDYPGWGNDIDALAARRSTETAVVVLEPRPAAMRGQATGPRTIEGTDGGGAADGTTPVASINLHADRDLSASGVLPGAIERWPRRLARRHLWLVPGLGLALLASQQATQLGAGLVPLLVFGIAPDLPRLAGIGRAHAPGQLPPRAVPLFNAMHHPIVPVALLLGLAMTGPASPFLLVGAFAWLGHVIVGFGTGDRLRTADGYVPVPAA